jgi:hypothetical protein
MAEQIEYPVGELQTQCAICGDDLFAVKELTKTYPNLVCSTCERKSVNADGDKPKRGAAYREKLKAECDNPEVVDVPSDAGENPVFIDGHKCWRRYRFGGFITQLDQFDCDTISEFKETHFPK